MKLSDRIENTRRLPGFMAAILSTIIVFVATDGYTAGTHDVSRPASSEFGPGPRTSTGKYYVAMFEAQQPLRPRKMQTVRVRIRDAAGAPVDGAEITIDGGMPQHGHGLPTRPRVTRNLGEGVYEIEGVRFNMGGWWEFKLAISSPAGDDSVTFNLDL
jgi:hypothetical protein